MEEENKVPVEVDVITPVVEPAAPAVPREQAIPSYLPQRQVPGVTSVGGIMEMRSLSQTLEDERARAEQENNLPMITGLAGHIRKCWLEAKHAKEQEVEPRMMKSMRQRNGEYEPDMLNILRRQNSALVYMLLTSNKCRAAAAWLREALQGMPWSCKPTPIADIDDATKQSITEFTQQQIAAAMNMGVFPSQQDVKEFMLAMRDQAFAKIQEMAKDRAERMTQKMKDQLFEGGFELAMDQFIDDLVTFPSAILKGPIVRKRPMLKWVPNQQGGFDAQAVDDFRLEWERVDPLMLYPAPDATSVDDGYLIERHRLSRTDLVSLRDVEGYSPAAINAVLDEYGRGGLHEWISIDSERILVEGKAQQANQNPSELIDALQFWGSVQGKMLVDWGVDEAEIENPLDEYHVEAWLIGQWVIKATINPDPLHRKPYYKTSWENIPGHFWGNSVPDLCRDTQAICNAAARALVNNMSISSGPQVVYDVSRLPAGEDLTVMYPWKIWQVKENGQGSTTQPISFFQPNSNAMELMQIYEKFSQLADEYTGIPRYMTGDNNVRGAGETASGLSMLMTNAGKTIKNVVASVDAIMKPAIERLYFYNMQYLDDPELKGDVNIIAEGAEALVRLQQQQQRQSEFLNICAQNPVLNQLIGPEGLSYMLREMVKTLGYDTDKIIPSLPVLKARMAAQQIQQMQAQAQLAAQQAQMQGQPQAGGSPAAPDARIDQRRLMDGSPQVNTQAVTNNAA